MCDIIETKKGETLTIVSELANFIGYRQLIIHPVYQGQTIKSQQCLCCIDIPASLEKAGIEYIRDDSGDYYIKR